MGKQQLHTLKAYAARPQAEQDRIRKESQTKSISIVAAILKDSKAESTDLTEFHHKQALEYLSTQLSIRDRRQIIRCLCKSTPDHLTMSVREVVDAYEPVIRRVHKAVDLSSTVSDFEYFLKDMLKLAKIHTDKSGKVLVPTVGDFAQLLRKHQRSCHVFLHQCCKNDKELTGWYLDWAKEAASQFKREQAPNSDPDSPNMTEKGAGHLSPSLQEMFSSLPPERQSRIIPILDSHSSFLEKMHSQSSARLASVLKSPPSKHPAIAKIFAGTGSSQPGSGTTTPISAVDNNSMSLPSPSDTIRESKENPPPDVSSSPGPGAFLARWQALLDATPITPLTQSGSLKAASSPEVVQSSAIDVDGSRLVNFGPKEARGEKIRVEESVTGKEGKPEDAVGIGHEAVERQKDMKVVIDALGGEFRQLLAERGLSW